VAGKLFGKRLPAISLAVQERQVVPGVQQMTTRSVWLEAALNGPWARTLQPGMPITVGELVTEGIACARAGAAIIHVHAYDERTGRQRDDAEIYRRIIEGIREQEDVIVYPTLPVLGGPDAPRAMTAPERFKAVEQLAMQGPLEWTVVDPGSVNFAHYDRLVAKQEGFVYLNPEGHVRYGLELSARYGFHPSYAIYEPGFLRLGAALARVYADAPAPVYRFMFSDGLAFGFPPKEYALDALKLLDDEAKGAPWMVAGLAVDIRPLIPAAVGRGGHVRVGLEDAPLGTEFTNLQWVEQAAAAIEQAGGQVASAVEVRRRLARSAI
jgi:3-keto-5-aminohexanoate cleavage enzyme